MQFLGPIDWLFVVLYLLVIGGVSIWSIRKSKETTSDYFLANRNLGWFVIGASFLRLAAGLLFLILRARIANSIFSEASRY